MKRYLLGGNGLPDDAVVEDAKRKEAKGLGRVKYDSDGWPYWEPAAHNAPIGDFENGAK